MSHSIGAGLPVGGPRTPIQSPREGDIAHFLFIGTSNTIRSASLWFDYA